MCEYNECIECHMIITNSGSFCLHMNYFMKPIVIEYYDEQTTQPTILYNLKLCERMHHFITLLPDENKIELGECCKVDIKCESLDEN